jgi:Tfp pilus assembly protein PilP
LADKVVLLALAAVMLPAVAWASADSTGVHPRLVSLAQADSILGRQHFYYSSLGKRDPFGSLLAGDFEKMGPDGLVDIDQVKLVGVMWGETDRFALVEDGAGYSYILRVGDRVRKGSVIKLTEDQLVATINFFGMTRTVVLKLEKE